jgi:hypothetical protein
MAVREVIHFPFKAQLSTRLQFPARFPPEPVAESPPKLQFQRQNLRRRPAPLSRWVGAGR